MCENSDNQTSWISVEAIELVRRYTAMMISCCAIASGFVLIF